MRSTLRSSAWTLARSLAPIHAHVPAIAALLLALLASLAAPRMAAAVPPMPTIVSMGTTSENTSGTATMPAGTEPGDLAIWHMLYSDTALVGGPPVINGWTLLYYDTKVGNGRALGQALYFRFLDGSEHGPQVASWHGEVDLTRISVYRGVDSSAPFEAGQIASGIGSSVRTLPNMTTTADNRLLTCFGGQTDDVPTLNISGETGGDWIERYEQGEVNSNNAAFVAHTAAMPTAGSITGTTGSSHGWPWLNRCFALAPGEGQPTQSDAPYLRLAGTSSINSNGTAVMPSGVRSGELAIWFMGYNQSNTSAPPTPPTLSGWTLLQYDQATNGSSHRVAQALYYRFLTGSEGGQTQTANWSTAVDVAWIDVYAGVHATTPFEGAALTSGPNGTRSMPSVTTTAADRLVLGYGIATTQDDSQITGASGGIWQFVRRQGEASSSNSQGELWAASLPSAGTISGGTSGGPGYPWLFRGFALRPSYSPYVAPASFTSPASLIRPDDAVRSTDAIEVAWTEDASVSARSLQRQVATAANYDACPAATFANDGAATTSASPVAQGGLTLGRCYRWLLTVTAGGQLHAVTSGTIYTVAHRLEVRHLPTTGSGDRTSLAVVVVDQDGQPSDAFAGPITVSSDDPAALYPDGDTYTLTPDVDLTGHTFDVRFGAAGERTITVRGTNAETATSAITVTATVLDAAAPATVYAGVPFALKVSAATADALPDPRYAGRVTFTSTDTTATWSRTTGTPPTFTFACNCDGGETFATRLTTLGAQTITVTDHAGNADTAEVTVLTAPGTAPSPVARLDRVKWNHGNAVDWYLTAVDGAAPFTVIEATNSCSQPSSGVGLRVVPNQDRFVEFTTPVPKPICDNDYLDDINHTLIVADDAGHTWTLTGNGFGRFTSVPNNTNFTMLDPGDPISAWAVAARPGGTTLREGDGRRWAYGANSLRIDFLVHEPTTITELYLGRPGITGYVSPWASPTTRFLPVGLSQAAFDDLTHTCYISNSWQGVNSGWIKYATHTGRSGAIANGGGIIPGAGSPTATCADPVDPDDGDPLDDLLDALNPDNWPFVGDVKRFMAADPVDPFTGAFTQSVTDVRLAGLSPVIELSRTYRSDRAERAIIGDPTAAGIFGPGWASNLDQRLFIKSGGSRVEWRGTDGGLTVFVRDSAGAYGTPASGVTLTTAGGTYRLESIAGEALLFNSGGTLTAIENREGRQLTLSYDGAGHLDSMTDAAGRTADITTDAAGRVTRVDLADGRYVAFTYSAAGQLATARSVSGTVIKYVTDSRGRVTELRNAADDVLLGNSYDDRGHVVSQQDAAGNTTWFTYDAEERLTQVIDPLGAVTSDCFTTIGQLDHRVDALGNAWHWTYDSRGNPTSATDPLGGVSRYAYDADGLPTSVTDPLGRTQTIAYDAEGLATQVTDHGGNTLTATYNAADRPTSVVRAEPASDPDPDSLTMATYTYTAAGLPETITEPGGAATLLAYDASGHLTSLTDAEGRQITYTVDARGFVTAVVDPLGNVSGGVPADHTTGFTYDAAGRVLSVTNAEDETTSFEYDAMGRLTETTSPLGTLTTNAYDLDGRLTSTTTDLTDTLDATTSFDYDAAGNLVRITDAEGRETEFEYDLLGRPVVRRDEAGKEWTTEYDALGRVVAVTDPTGRSALRGYDAAGRLVSTTDPAGQETTYAYNDRDQPVSVTDPLERVTTYTYDWLGRQTGLTNAEDETTTSVFDDAGDLVSLTDAEAKTTSFVYDDTHLLLEVTDAADGVTSYAYDAGGRLVERTNARDKLETFAYDDVGRLLSTTDALDNVWSTAYDADGRIDATIDANGQTTEFAFDRGGRLVSLDPHGAMAPITFTYDDTGRQLTMSDTEGASSFAYDPTGRLTSYTRDGASVGYAYDDAGRPTAVTWPGSGGSVGYAYDTAGRLATITDWASRTTTMTYDDASRVTSVARPAGLTTSFAYDDVDRVLAIDHLQGGNPLLALDYTYDDVGNLLTASDDTGTASFAYNDLHQLTSANYPGSDDFTYAYDPVGNLTQRVGPDGTLARTYTDADQLATETLNGGTPRTFTYDDNGALTNDGAGRSFSHDVLGRLTAVDGPVDATYAYDGAGRRISATVDAVTTDFLLDIRGLGSVLSDGTRRFLPGAPNAGYESDGAWVNALTDQQGTVMGHADAVGLVGNLTHYDPYGAPMPGESGLGSGPGFTGEWSDATGLLDLRARAYDPSLHSFMVRDSFGGVASAPLSANRYAYALGNPLRYTDPSGHFVNEFLRNPGLWFSAGLQFIPVVGDAYSLATGLIGFDPIAGFELSGTDRALAMAGGLALGGGFHLLGHVDDIARAENRVDALGDVGSGVGRSADDLGDFTRSGDNLGPSLRPGDTFGGARGADAPASAGPGPSRARDGGDAPRLVDDRVHEIPPGSSGGVGAGERIPQSLRDEWFPGGHEPPLCSYCRTRPASTLDHVEPRSLGGDLTPGNIAPACTHCNPSKGPRVAPKSPPREYVGPWPPPHWPQRMQDWWRQTYGGGL